MATDSIQRYHSRESNRSVEGKHWTTWWKGNFQGKTFQWECWDENEKPFKKNYRNNKTVFLLYNSPVRQFSVRIARKTYTAPSRRKKKSRFVSIECVWSPHSFGQQFHRASVVYLQRGLKLDRTAQDWNARAPHLEQCKKKKKPWHYSNQKWAEQFLTAYFTDLRKQLFK